MKYKYALLVGDGMADFPIPELGNRTPLEYAQTPAMDAVAGNGMVGLVATVPHGLPPGSDVANMSLMGYDPRTYYSGRAPIEAASLGVKLDKNDAAFRCNLVTLHDGLMKDYSAGHIGTDEAREIVAELRAALNKPGRTFFPGVSYRHLLVLADLDLAGLQTTPPHDISGQPWKAHLPRGPMAPALVELMDQARDILARAATNKRRLSQGKPAATDIWLWGEGRAVSLPTMMERFGLTGTVISAVDLVRGLGTLAGLDAPIVPGATGYLGTNYAGKVEAASKALDAQDFVFVHVEAPDETSHEGSLHKKIQAIEEFDRNVVARFLQLQKERPALQILVAPDHATPLSIKTHHAMPVPFAACGSGVRRDGGATYCEKAAAGSTPHTGASLFAGFVGCALSSTRT